MRRRSPIHAYGDPRQLDLAGILIGAVQTVGPDFNGPTMDFPPLEFHLAERERLRGRR